MATQNVQTCRQAIAPDPRGRCRRGAAALIITAAVLGILTSAHGGGLLRQAASTSGPIAIAVPDLAYVDTSGEVRDQRQEHAARVQHFGELLRRDLASSGRYRIVDPICVPSTCSAADTDPATLVKAARTAGARLLLFGGVHKESTLVQWAMLQAIDVATEKVVLDKLFTFRGDDDKAWNRAEAFVAGELIALPVSRNDR